MALWTMTEAEAKAQSAEMWRIWCDNQMDADEFAYETRLIEAAGIAYTELAEVA